MTEQGLSFVVPVYNGSRSLRELQGRLEEMVSKLGVPWEMIFVDDGSRDDSWSVITDMAEKRKEVRGIRLSRNYGQHNALLCGIRECNMPITVTIDDDLQNPPEEVPKLLKRLDADTDVVYGTPTRERHSFWRRMASRFTKAVLRSAMGAHNASRVSAFRVFKTRLRDAFEDYRGTFVSVDVLLSWGTTTFDSVDVDHEPRKYGCSQYSATRLIKHALNMMTGFSTLPLEIASLAGFAFTVFGLGVLAYVVGRYLIEGGSVPGFPFLASIIAIFSGVQLFSLGIIGEYLARIHFRVMDKPPYSTRSDTSALESEEDSRR